MPFDEYTDLSVLAKTVKKKVHGLIAVYSLLILATFLLFLITTLVIGLLLLGLYLNEHLYTRLLWLGFLVIGAAGYCLVVVLKPLFKIFRRKDRKGTEIYRKDYPELFALIDEVIQKVDCKEPKHVRLSNECNAYVFHSSLFGYMFTDRQNLTIGLPLIYGMNKTELKSILSHEFGHFTQKSVSTNRTANLSEFICASIVRAIDEAENSKESTAKLARSYVRLAGTIMEWQYHKVAPYNGILSRAQEFDADHYSQMVAGTDGSVSALCKLDRISERWIEFEKALVYYQKNEKRSPVNVFQVYQSFFCEKDIENHEIISPVTHFDRPVERVESRIRPADNLDTHPSMMERITAIRSYPAVETEWNNDSAIDYVDSELISFIFDREAWDIKQALDPGAIVFDREKDITPLEIQKKMRDSVPQYLEWFGPFRLFFQDDARPDDIINKAVQSISSPFTEENARILEEYYTAEDDLMDLLSLSEKDSSVMPFRYLGEKYVDAQIPLERHKKYYESLNKQATAIAKQCNHWLDNKALEKEERQLLYLYRISAVTDYSLRAIKNAMETVYAIVQSKDGSSNAQEYVRNVDKEFRNRIQGILGDDENTIFDYISSVLDTDKELVRQVKAYYKGDLSGAEDLCQAYTVAGKSAYGFTGMAWDRIKKELILGRPVEESEPPRSFEVTYPKSQDKGPEPFLLI